MEAMRTATNQAKIGMLMDPFKGIYWPGTAKRLTPMLCVLVGVFVLVVFTCILSCQVYLITV